MCVALIQDDINKLIEEGELQCKLDELNKLEEAAKNSQDPAWLVTVSIKEDVGLFVCVCMLLCLVSSSILDCPVCHYIHLCVFTL